MSHRIQEVLLFICAVVVALLAVSFFMRAVPIQAQAPLLTEQLLNENRAELEQQEQKRQHTQAARRRAELEKHLYQCQANEDCIIVDKNPCGCLKGPNGVTAINSTHVMEFARMMEKQFPSTVSCPSVGSAERECSATATAVCDRGRCRIAY